MIHKAYISNIALGWTLEQQEALLAKNVPGWPVTLYREVLPARALRARNPAMLLERAALARPTSRRSDEKEVFHVASLGALAWRQDDFAAFIASLAGRKPTLISHHDDLAFHLNGSDSQQAAVEAFPVSRKNGSRQKGRLIGARNSAEIRNARSKAACEKIKERWGMPSTLYKTAHLIAETGFSRNTVQRWVGKRPAAQARYQRNLKRKLKANDE